MRRARPNLRRYVQPVTSAAAPAATPLTIMGANCIQWCRSDMGVTESGGKATVWADQVNSANNYLEGGAGLGPTVTPGLLNGQTGLVFVPASTQWLVSPLNLPLPGTTPTVVWMIMRVLSWSNARCFIDGDGAVSKLTMRQDTATPDIKVYNGAFSAANSNLVLNTGRRVEAYFSNTVNDYLKVGSVSVTGTNTGNVAATTGRRIGRNGGVTLNYAHFELYEIAYFDALPSAGQLAALDTYASDRYGAGVLA